jgi:hypothetical protein
MKKACFMLLLFLFGIAKLHAQKNISSQKSLVFSAIKGTYSKPDSVLLPVTIKRVKFDSGDSSNFIVSFKKGKLVINFAPNSEFEGIAKAKLLAVSSTKENDIAITLTGLSTKGLEGENEATLTNIATALGYQVNIGWTTLANHSRPELQGDEISSSIFQKSGKGNIEMIPVARYSPDFELPFGYYTNNASMPDKHQVGILAKAGKFPEHQILFPAISSGSHSFDPGNASFGFYATGPTHTAYSEDVWNMLMYPENAVRATRIYPLKNANGIQIPNTYLLCFEEAKNGDYNDYVFIVKNIKPITNNPFVRLFNGKNLNGWHTYLEGIGKNVDPSNNFIIQDSMLHVIGKDLGYVITETGYSNFHFKVDFKWGERRWGSRQNEKRDAGVCYNIGMNEPDSIWPKSIECQIQEGDVGDFWLLGFSTIQVNGVQNLPANHTRMIKQKDAEKPTGEWNTVEIISYNGKCVQIVNGVIVNVGQNASVKEGRILLQSEFAEIYYKNVLIRKL